MLTLLYVGLRELKHVSKSKATVHLLGPLLVGWNRGAAAALRMHARLTLGRSWVQFPSRPRLPKQETADKMATGAERMKLKQVREKVGRLGLDGNRTKGLQSFETSTHPQCHNSSTVLADQRWTQ